MIIHEHVVTLQLSEISVVRFSQLSFSYERGLHYASINIIPIFPYY